MIEKLVDHYRQEVVNALWSSGIPISQILYDILTYDPTHTFLDCFDAFQVDQMYQALIMPPTATTKPQQIIELMASDLNLLANEIINLYPGEAEQHLINCISSALLKDALKNSGESSLTLADALSYNMPAPSLASFFTGGNDPKPWRPFVLLKTYGSHNAMLNVIASNDPENFIYHGLDQDHWMVDEILPELTNFTATHYITSIKQYFGSTDATRTQNAIGLDFVYEQQFATKEYNLYGSSRLGVKKDTSKLVNTRFKASSIDESGNFVNDVVYFKHLKETDTVRTARILAFKQFELSNHLGNVLATILDRRTLLDTTIYNSGNDTAAIWDADIVSAQDYYPGGSILPGRNYTAGSSEYEYGFQGQLKDDELYGKGNMLIFLHLPYCQKP